MGYGRKIRTMMLPVPLRMHFFEEGNATDRLNHYIERPRLWQPIIDFVVSRFDICWDIPRWNSLCIKPGWHNQHAPFWLLPNKIIALAAATDTYQYLAASQRRSKLKLDQCDEVLVSQSVRESFRRLDRVIKLDAVMRPES